MSDELEDLDAFRDRARTWIRANVKPEESSYLGVLRDPLDAEQELAQVQHDRDLQRALFDAGLAGICVPTEYGGQGLTPAHQRVLNEEISGYERPFRAQVPTMSPCMAVLLDFGTEEQKRTHVPAILKGEELWMQLLSEPSGGSDVAGALTSAVRDGDEWVLNGSKVWTTGAWWSDWGLCLARTNWDVPKHRGLTVFILPLHQPGIEIQRIEMLNGSEEFCQEFLTDVVVPDSDRVGDVDQGWTVGTRWMFHERMLMSSPYVTMAPGVSEGGSEVGPHPALAAAQELGRLDDPAVQDLVGEALVLERVAVELNERVGSSVRSGSMSDQASAVARLYRGMERARVMSILFEISGAAGGVWGEQDDELSARGIDFLLRQVGSIGGGTTEMARNVVSERVLGMPREPSVDKDVPFRDVPRSPS